ncbi:MAG: YncE family protein [Terriglobales bacterium]
MNLSKVARFGGALLLLFICAACGDVYRPVATPIVPSPPNPAFSKAVFVISENGPQNPGSSSQIDVSGDTTLGVVRTGVAPVHAVLTPDSTKVYVANEFEDTLSEFQPGTPNSINLAPVTTVSLPAGSHPIFVATAQNDKVFSANFGTGTVAAISTSQNVATQIIPLSQTVPNPIQPVAMAETPNGAKLYVANQQNGATAGSVSSINPTDNSINPPVANSWSSPVWVAARSDSARAYILDAGAGTVSAINTSTDTVLPNPVTVGAGANFMFYDAKHQRLYVTNPANGSVSIIDVSTDPLNLVATDCVVAGSTPPCPTTFAPVSATVLPDGSSAYVASYQIGSTCPSGIASPCLTSQVSVINSSSNQVSTVIPLGSAGVDMTNQTGCGAPGPLGSRPAVRFRLSIATAGDSSRVYVANCDAESTAIISASPTSSDPYPANTLITNLQPPVSAFPPPPSSPGLPPPQSPVFIVATP